MLQYLNQKRGQSTLEYAILIVVIIGALLTIQIYMKRGIQGRLKSASDDIGDQYSDGNTNDIKTVVTNSSTEETMGVNGVGVSTYAITNGGEITNTTENSVIANSQLENWGGGSSSSTTTTGNGT